MGKINDRVAVWVDCSREPPEDEAEMIYALALFMDDPMAAIAVACGRHKTSADAWKAVVAGPVTHKAAEVLVRWLSSSGMHAMIDDEFYTDDEEREAIRRFS